MTGPSGRRTAAGCSTAPAAPTSLTRSGGSPPTAAGPPSSCTRGRTPIREGVFTPDGRAASSSASTRRTATETCSGCRSTASAIPIPILIKVNDDKHPRVSPDGRLLAYTSNETGPGGGVPPGARRARARGSGSPVGAGESRFGRPTASGSSTGPGSRSWPPRSPSSRARRGESRYPLRGALPHRSLAPQLRRHPGRPTLRHAAVRRGKPGLGRRGELGRGAEAEDRGRPINGDATDGSNSSLRLDLALL